LIAKIRKRDGRIVAFDREKISAAVEKAFRSVNQYSKNAVRTTTDDVVRALEDKYRRGIPSVEEVQDLVEKALIDNAFVDVAKSYILYRRKRTEIRESKRIVGVTDDLKLSLNATKVLERRYLKKDETGKVIETPSQLFRRVAHAIAGIDRKYDSRADVGKTEEIFYAMMSGLEFLPNSPTLMNAGTPIGQLSACFVIPIEDTLSSIFDAVKATALIHKSGGGTGFSFSKLRPHGDIVKTSGGVASGPVSFMKIFDATTEEIKQGGRRRGANMGILDVSHPDIIEFITAKSKPGFLRNFNISVAVNDEFMEHAPKKSEVLNLVSPRSGKVTETVHASEIFQLITSKAWETGDPGLIFIDEINRKNPTPKVGKIEATNPCVTSDAWIMTEEGPRQVKDLIGKPFVAIDDGRRWNGSKEGFFSKGVKPIFRMKTEEGFEVELTSNHPVLKVTELTRNRRVTEWVDAGNLKPKDKVMLNDHRKLDGWEGKYTEGEGYLVGLLLEDGWITTDKAILGSWGEDGGARAVRALAYSYAKKLPHQTDFHGWMRDNGTDRYRMATGCLNKILLELGLRRGAKTITSSIEQCSSDFCRGLLRGFFDTDGSLQGSQTRGVSIRLAQSDVPILLAVQRMLLRFGIFSTIYRNRWSEGYASMPDGGGGKKMHFRKPHHELVISKENILKFQKRIGFGDSCKSEKLAKAIASYKRTPNRERFIATVAAVEQCGETEVYDAIVPGINAFDANGFHVHNCGEQPLLPYESCNLGSINLTKFVTNGREIDWGKLRSTVKNAVHFLDNVIDANKYPLVEVSKITRANRKIGLGVMGFAEMLIMLNVRYDSEKALKIARELMSFTQRVSHEASEELAKTRGSFPNFKNSIWAGKGYKHMRNATTTTIAPTGAISIIAGCSSGIEPIFAVSFVREVMEGTKLFEVNPQFEKISKDRGLYSQELLTKIAESGSVQNLDVPKDMKEIFRTALDISPEWHIKIQAEFQKHVDNAVSKTINMAREATVEDVRKAYILAWRLKCKGITVYRYGSKPEQVLTIGSIEKANVDTRHVVADSEYAGGCAGSTCPY
jgi:ribonucleoside-diphosphate reductase alpha chain